MHFTIEQLDQALTCVNQTYKIDGGHFEIAREKYHQETLQFFRNVFWADEPVCNSLGLEWSQACADFHMQIIQENLTLIAVDDDTDEIMGIRIISLAKKDETLDPNIFQDENVKKLFTFMISINQKADFYNHYGVTEAFEFVALAVGQKYRKCGLGSKLMRGAVCFLKQIGLKNCYVKSLGTSEYSQKIFEKTGFESIYEIEYKSYVVDGKVVFKNTGIHEKAVVYAMKL